MKPGTNKIYLLLLIGLMLSLGSCNLVRPFFIKNKKKEERKEKREEKKEAKKTERKDSSLVIVKKDSLVLPMYDTSKVRDILASRRIEYKTYQCKAKMHFESGDNHQNFTANFRLEKGKTIWVSINVGIEVARAIITPDSVKAFERINKKAYLYTYKDIQKLINLEVDFATLQDLIIGNTIATEGVITDVKNLAGRSTIFVTGKDFKNQITLNKTDSVVKQIHLQTERAVSTSSILIGLNDYQLIDARYISTNRDYNIQDLKGAAQLSMEVNKCEFDKELEFPFSIPAKYKYQN